MPTIEIASTNSKGLDLRQADFHVAIIEENKLESHRGHFYDFLYHQQGTIIHIGNPEFADDKEGGYSAGNIINWNYSFDIDSGCVWNINCITYFKEE